MPWIPNRIDLHIHFDKLVIEYVETALDQAALDKIAKGLDKNTAGIVDAQKDNQ